MIAFTDIVGLDMAKQALLLLAVDPSLGGAIIPASVGSGKSTLARAFADVLPEGTPFVDLPLNVTEDRLIGGLDLEAAIATGERVIEQGLLSKAHKGVLYVDSLSLLEGSATSHVMDAMSRGAVLVEREGLSEVHPAEFMLVGTYDPTDGEVRMGLLDRIGLIVPFTKQNDYRARKEIVRKVMRETPNEDAQDEVRMIAGLVQAAREQLGKVAITQEQIEGLVQSALTLGVEGNRVDIFTIKTAIASAALSGRNDVEEEDLKIAAKLVLVPRATRMPESEEEIQQEAPPPPPPEMEEQETAGEASDEDTPDTEPQDKDNQTPEQIEELLMEAVETELPESILNISVAVKSKSRSGHRGEALNGRRGRYIRSQMGEIRSGKIAIIPTLIAASPWQRSRQNEYPHRKDSLIILKDDVRIKRFRDKAGTLYVFIVDASGSMALNRMRQAKGAVGQLLQSAYVHRDQVSLIAFRGQVAQVLLPPSQSVERAKRALDVLPTGGGTPLASALYMGWQEAVQMRTKGIHQAMLVVITDGRGNIPFNVEVDAQNGSTKPTKEQIQQEIEKFAKAINIDGIDSVVVDTQMNYLSRGEAPKLAQALGGRYVYLPNAKAEQIVNAALGE
ncbi:magnesium chelatase ATPase subunit D [Chloroherpeton thalassium ATCC 35110]|uniref:Mg-protoporphyrin IX chelatase n=1 Tax=Chloroherpeton thalassium (strain ATCC 35110 / GB-78) TaxID=517418 RepID=B3QVC6_CHLT3|nr:magnesium chelatase ATPase subunit D [Chloroherpeton thalassium]ACF14526.1 magnesium chelatase ATPase subunit D [Chloroherpeton thalassium ATCC 35110]